MYSFDEIDGDINIVDGEVKRYDNDVKLCVESAVNTRQGEFFLDTDMGMDYDPFETKQYAYNELDLSLREAIFQDERIDEIGSIDIELDKATRKIDIVVEEVVAGDTVQDLALDILGGEED